MQSGIVFRMTIVFAAKAHKSWPYTSVTNVSDELSLEIRAGYMLEVSNIIELCYISKLYWQENLWLIWITTYNNMQWRKCKIQFRGIFNIWGYSTTTWTQFDPIWSSLVENCYILHKFDFTYVRTIYPLFTWTNVDFRPTYLFLSTRETFWVFHEWAKHFIAEGLK